MKFPVVIKNSSLFLVGNLFSAVIPFVLLPILTRFLSPKEMGVVVNYQLLLNLITIIGTLGVSSAVGVQYFKLNFYGMSNLVVSALVINALGFSFVTIMSVFLGPALNVIGIGGQLMWWSIVSGAIGGFSAIVLVLLQSSGKALLYILFQISLSLLSAALSLVLVVVHGGGAEGRIYGSIIPVMLFGLLAAIWLYRSYFAQGRLNRASLGIALRFCLPLLPHSLSSIALAQGDRFILGQRIGLEEAGVYAVAMQLMLPLLMIADAVNKAFAPWVYRQLALRNAPVVAAGQILLSFFYLSISVAYILTLLIFVELFLGDRFSGAKIYIYMIAPGAFAGAMYYVFVNQIFFAERTELLTAITVTAAIVYVGSGWWAAGIWGGVGLAIAYAGVSIIQLAAVFFMSKKSYPVPYRAGMSLLGTYLWKRPENHN